MKLENQVCTLEQSKRLKKFGIQQISSHHWLEGNPAVREYSGKGYMISRTNCFAHASEDWEDSSAAFNVTEVLQMLPAKPETVSIELWHYDSNVDGERRYGAKIIHDVNLFTDYVTNNASMAVCLTDILIKILEMGYDTVENVNQRLLNT